MSEPYIGEIRLFGGTFAPVGWALCQGQLLSISENEALFNLIGTTYGGDGQSTFALPDLRGRLPIHRGNTFAQGQSGGTESVTLTQAQLPAHSHPLLASIDVATIAAPANQVLARSTGATVSPYGSDAPRVSLAPGSVTSVGSGQPHDNMQPYLCVNFIIALEGIYPSQN